MPLEDSVRTFISERRTYCVLKTITSCAEIVGIGGISAGVAHYSNSGKIDLTGITTAGIGVALYILGRYGSELLAPRGEELREENEHLKIYVEEYVDKRQS